MSFLEFKLYTWVWFALPYNCSYFSNSCTRLTQQFNYKVEKLSEKFCFCIAWTTEQGFKNIKVIASAKLINY